MGTHQNQHNDCNILVTEDVRLRFADDAVDTINHLPISSCVRRKQVYLVDPGSFVDRALDYSTSQNIRVP